LDLSVPGGQRRRAATIGFAVGLVLIAGLGVNGVIVARDATTAVTSVERSHSAIESLVEISARLGEARSVRRAYGLTGDVSYRDTFEEEVAMVPKRIASVRALTAEDPKQQHQIAELEPLVADRIARMSEQLATRDALGKDIPLDDAHSLANGQLDEAIRRHTNDLIAREHELLDQREADSSDRSGRATLFFAGSAAIAFVLLLSAFAINRYEIRERERAEAKTAGALAASIALNAELESFSYSVSHDLRTPLRAIDGFSQALLEDCGDKLDEQGKSHLDRVRAGTQRMGVLIDDILALSRVTRSKMELQRFDLSALAAEALAELRETNPEREVEVTIAPDLNVNGDPRLVRIVLDNLLGNAFKFTAKRTKAHIEVGATTEKGERALFVRDDGVGFDPRYAEKLFGAFQRLHDAKEFSGTGIGLATVQRIVHRHGGRIWAISEPDKGATFFFTLPGAEAREEV